jgi:methyltransferase (TIGR00027 family)
MGTLDDPLAESMLRARGRLAARSLRRWPLTRYARSPTFSFLAARTRFFDDEVTRALDDGIDQVAIIGAGYDSRAWRLARPGVHFFEVDHPATQRDKRLRAPTDGPTYVPADLSRESLAELLPAAGFRIGTPSVFVIEGLTMYLTEVAVTAMLSALAEVSGSGSRMAVNFTVSGGGSVSPISRAVAKVIRMRWALSGEPMHQWVRKDTVPALLDRTGWAQRDSLPGPALAEQYLAGTNLSIDGLNPGAFCVAATRT